MSNQGGSSLAFIDMDDQWTQDRNTAIKNHKLLKGSTGFSKREGRGPLSAKAEKTMPPQL